jgi:hypothetical protein
MKRRSPVETTVEPLPLTRLKRLTQHEHENHPSNLKNRQAGGTP